MVSYIGLVLISIVGIVQIIGSVKLQQMDMFHHTVTLLQLAVHLQICGFLFMSVLYARMDCEECSVPGSSDLVYAEVVFPAIAGALPLSMLFTWIIGAMTKRHAFTILLFTFAVWCVGTLTVQVLLLLLAALLPACLGTACATTKACL